MTTARSDRTHTGLAARQHAVADAVHSTELEGGTVPADITDYETGHIDIDELLTRTRYGARQA